MIDRHLKTARVRWRMGQPLLPEHFYTQEESLRAETTLRLSMLSVPRWGLGELMWDLSPEGRLRIHQLVLVLPDGSVVDVPGNCDAPPAIDLAAIGQSEVSIYLHRGSSSRFTHDSPHGEPDNVERTVHQIEILPHPSVDPDEEPFKLAEVTKSVDDEWQLSTKYIPPTLQVARSPFFIDPVQRTRNVVESLHEILVEEIRNAFLSAEATTSAKQCLRGVFRTQAVLTDLAGDIDLHPAELWQVLTELYLDICVHRGIDPREHLIPYTHLELGACFERMLSSLENQVSIRRTETPYAQFRPEGNMLVCYLPSEVRHADRIFWLIQKNRVGDELDLRQIKVASSQRLPTVHQLALKGVPVKPLEEPPFHHSFTAEVAFFELTRGAEWDHAVREGKIGLYARDDVASLRSFLYWRRE